MEVESDLRRRPSPDYSIGVVDRDEIGFQGRGMMPVVGIFLIFLSVPVFANGAPCGQVDQNYYTLLRCSGALERLAQIKDEGVHGTHAFFQGSEPNVKRSEIRCPTGTPVRSFLGFRQDMEPTERLVYHLTSMKQGGGYVVHNFQIGKNGCIEPSRLDYVNTQALPTASAQIPIMNIKCRPSSEDGVGVVSVSRYYQETDANRGRVTSTEMIHRADSIGTPFTKSSEVDPKQALELLVSDVTRSLQLLKESFEGSDEAAQDLISKPAAKDTLQDLSLRCQEGLRDLKKMSPETVSPALVTTLEQNLAPVAAFSLRLFTRGGANSKGGGSGASSTGP